MDTDPDPTVPPRRPAPPAGVQPPFRWIDRGQYLEVGTPENPPWATYRRPTSPGSTRVPPPPTEPPDPRQPDDEFNWIRGLRHTPQEPRPMNNLLRGIAIVLGAIVIVVLLVWLFSKGASYFSSGSAGTSIASEDEAALRAFVQSGSLSTQQADQVRAGLKLNSCSPGTLKVERLGDGSSQYVMARCIVDGANVWKSWSVSPIALPAPASQPTPQAIPPQTAPQVSPPAQAPAQRPQLPPRPRAERSRQYVQQAPALQPVPHRVAPAPEPIGPLPPPPVLSTPLAPAAPPAYQVPVSPFLAQPTPATPPAQTVPAPQAAAPAVQIPASSLFTMYVRVVCWNDWLASRAGNRIIPAVIGPLIENGLRERQVVKFEYPVTANVIWQTGGKTLAGKQIYVNGSPLIRPDFRDGWPVTALTSGGVATLSFERTVFDSVAPQLKIILDPIPGYRVVIPPRQAFDISPSVLHDLANTPACTGPAGRMPCDGAYYDFAVVPVGK